MKVSLNWVKMIAEQYQTSANLIPSNVNDLVEKIGNQLGAVEKVIDVSKKYEGIVVVKVISCEKHPNADKLSVCMIDTGRGKPVQVVCGAPNVKAGMLAAWIPPGNTVPSTYGKGPFVLEAREIRGVVSNGMLASAKELAIGDDHSGIVEIDKDAKPGDNFAKLYRMDDYVIDIENKMFTHRPDCFGMLGIARELAGIQNIKFKSPDWYREDVSIASSRARDDHKLVLKNKVPKLVPRFCAVVIKDVKVAPSPIWLRASLSRVDVKSINSVVDLTNFHMLLTAQPLHAYDYDKVLALQKDKKNGVKMGVRLSKKGEKLELLGSKVIKLEDGAVLITAADKPIGLGGVMGGADTEVDENTKNIILECANFDMNITRRTAMHYGLFTDAATRFTKGQSPRQNLAVLAKAVEDIRQVAGGRVSSVVGDKNFKDAPRKINVTTSFINERLGEKLNILTIKKLLENVEFNIGGSGEKLQVTAPFWRTDIEIPEDVVEEVGRLYGYDKLPQFLPLKDLSPASTNKLLHAKSTIRQKLAAAGANEVLTYSFVHGSLLKKVGQDPKYAYQIRNALSPDLQYYRLSLMPSLLEKIHPNIKLKYDIFALFEIGKVHSKERPEDKTGLPVEDEYTALAITTSDKLKPAGSAYYLAAKYLNDLVGEPLEFKPITGKMQSFQVMQPYQAGRSAMVHLKSNGKFLGIIGEFKPNVTASLKLPKYCAGFELDTTALAEVLAQPPTYQPLSRFPALDQDITLKLQANISYGEATDFIYKFLDKAADKHGYQGQINPLDIYQKPGDTAHKQITWRIILSHPEKTLTTVEVNKLLEELSAKTKEGLGAERI